MVPDPDSFECYVIAVDMADAARYVSGFIAGPHLEKQYHMIQPTRATVLLVEQVFFKEPHVTEKARAEIDGFRHKECEAAH
jgi:hypothetical protein